MYAQRSARTISFTFTRFGTLIRVLLVLLLCVGCKPVASPDIYAPPQEPARISDKDALDIARAVRIKSDRSAMLNPHASHSKRLDRLTRTLKQEQGYQLSFAVYTTKKIYASATPDGAIRISSGLMDRMTDQELRFVIAHTVGHMVEGDYMLALRRACDELSLNALAGDGPQSIVAIISDQQLDALQARLNSTVFSLEQELAADSYAYQFMKRNTYDLRAGISVLKKLATPSQSSEEWADPRDCARRIAQFESLINAGTPAKRQ